MSHEPISIQFWRRIHAYAEKQVRERHLAWWGHDRKCPNCKTWGSVHGAWASIQKTGPMTEILKCERCGFGSEWRLDSMLPYLSPTQPLHTVTAYDLETDRPDLHHPNCKNGGVL